MRITWLLGMLIASAVLILADPLAVSTSAVDTVCIGSGSPPFCDIFRVQQNQDASGNAVLNGTFGPPSAQETVSADAHAAYGVLNASATSSFNVLGTPETDFISANSNFEDVMTITDPADPSLDGQPGLLNLKYSLDGTLSGSAFAVVLTDAGTTLQQQWTQQYFSSVDGAFSLPAPIEFVFGQPFGLSIQLSVSAGTPTAYGVLNPETGAGSGIADFFSTFVLTGLEPTDASGDPVTGAVFSSQSGTAYSTDGVVPEPSLVIPLLFGIAIIAVLKRR
jgi:hypothetical protein